MITVRMAAAAISCVVLAACSGSDDAPVTPARPKAEGTAKPEEKPKTLTFRLPTQLLGLSVKTEDVALDLGKVTKGIYFDSVGLFSFREKELLRATLQVSRFNDRAQPDRASFRANILARLGSTIAEELRVGDSRVSVTTGNQQAIFVWFEKNGFYALSVRSDYPFPRTLLRRLLDADLKL